MADTFLRLPEVKHRTGLSRSTIYAAVSAGEFPKPVRLTERTIAWVESDVQDWIDARIAASRDAA